MHPYQNSSLNTSTRVEDLLSRMTAEEKIGQMMQLPANQPGMMEMLESHHIGSYLHCTGSMMTELQGRAEHSRLGIPLLFGIDAIHGHCFNPRGSVFPSQLALSSSWNLSLIRRLGKVTAEELRADGLHWTFSPVFCIGRDPRWGRIDETFGEDPWLIGELGAELVQAYEENQILACAKHFTAYGESTGGRD